MINLVAPETVLETQRLLLEPLMPKHASQIYEKLLDSRIYQFIPQDPPVSIQSLEDRYTALLSRLSPDKQEAWLNWIMRDRSSNALIGRLEATVYNDYKAEMAYIVFPEFWQQGYAKEGCARIIEHLFQDYKVNVIAAEIDTRNIASIRLVESLGMKCVSVKNNADYFKGMVSHEYRYELNLNSLSIS